MLSTIRLQGSAIDRTTPVTSSGSDWCSETLGRGNLNIDTYSERAASRGCEIWSAEIVWLVDEVGQSTTELYTSNRGLLGTRAVIVDPEVGGALLAIRADWRCRP
jgi:hypothetical protein